MGDGEYGDKYTVLEGACDQSPHSPPTCVKIAYTFGPKRWAGIYWQNQPDNWGDRPGQDFSTKGFKAVTFWARGAKGGEVVEFKSGGASNPAKKYHDSYLETTGRVTLTKEWQKFTIDLSSKDLSSVLGGFCWVAEAKYNQGDKITFYLDDIDLQ